jgi:hypothetical protein
MATQRNPRFVVGLLAALCIGMAVGSANGQPAGGTTTPDDHAASKDARPREDGSSAASQNPSHDGSKAKKGDDGEHSDRGLPDKGKGSSAKGADTPDVRMKDLGPVDTRITVAPQPHRSDLGKQTPPLHSPTGLRTQPPQMRRPGAATTRNSIGEAVPSSAQPAARAPSPGGIPGTMVPPGTERRTDSPGNAAAAPGNPALAPLHARPLTTAPVPPRSTIDGGSIARRGNTPAAIGGQAKPPAGINGSTIRLKH